MNECTGLHLPHPGAPSRFRCSYISTPKRLAVVLTGGIATTLGVGLLSVVGPVVFGERSPFRFAS